MSLALKLNEKINESNYYNMQFISMDLERGP